MNSQNFEIRTICITAITGLLNRKEDFIKREYWIQALKGVKLGFYPTNSMEKMISKIKDINVLLDKINNQGVKNG